MMIEVLKSKIHCARVTEAINRQRMRYKDCLLYTSDAADD